MTRAQIPEQAESKQVMRAWLAQNPHVVLSDIAHETAIPFTSLYSWINGRTLNFKTRAYIQAVARWIKKHESEVAS